MLWLVEVELFTRLVSSSSWRFANRLLCSFRRWDQSFFPIVPSLLFYGKFIRANCFYCAVGVEEEAGVLASTLGVISLMVCRLSNWI